jgi:hypothetical protein
LDGVVGGGSAGLGERNAVGLSTGDLPIPVDCSGVAACFGDAHFVMAKAKLESRSVLESDCFDSSQP